MPTCASPASSEDPLGNVSLPRQQFLRGRGNAKVSPDVSMKSENQTATPETTTAKRPLDEAIRHGMQGMGHGERPWCVPSIPPAPNPKSKIGNPKSARSPKLGFASSRRVDLGGRPPGPPQIRTCALNASGSSSHDVATLLRRPWTTRRGEDCSAAPGEGIWPTSHRRLGVAETATVARSFALPPGIPGGCRSCQ